MKKPLISVVMPAYNHQAYIGEAIGSVLGQSFGDLELIIIDDGSTDESAAVVKAFDDPRLQYHWQENHGAHHALNRGIALAQGQYLAILNSDDAFALTRLEQLLHIAQQEDARFIITDINLIDRSSQVVQDNTHWWLRWYEGLKNNYSTDISAAEYFLAGNFAITSSNFFFRADMVQAIGPFRPFRYILDYDYAFKAALACPEGFRFLVGSKLLNYRLHGNNTILENPLKANLEAFFFLKMATIKCYGKKLGAPLQHLSTIKSHIVKIQRNSFSRKVSDIATEMESLRIEKDTQLADKESNISQLVTNIAGLTDDVLQLNDHNSQLRAQLATSQHELALLQNSKSYRIGVALATPHRWFLARFVSPAHDSRLVKASADNATELRAILEKLTNRVKVVSFDIFDTLLERDIDPPEEVKSIIAKKVAQHLSECYGTHYSVSEVVELRNAVDAALRKEARDQGMDNECKFSELARDLAKRLAGKEDPELAAKIVAIELQVEKEVLFVKRDMAQVLEWLNGRGIRVIAVSDMYLDQEHLQNIFESKGLHVHVDRIYVSSETATGKYSGRLFDHVLGNEGLQPADMVHIGDNHHSDYLSPARMGIHSIHFDDKASIRRRLTLRAYRKLSSENPYWRGRYLLQVVRPAPSSGFHYDYGFQTLGPVYATFVLGVIEQLKKNKVRNVYFLAREGELFLKLFQVLAPYHFSPEDLPTARYLYVSRRSTATASAFRGLTHEIATIPLYNPKQQGFHSIFNTFGLKSDAFIEVCRKHGYVDLKKPIQDWHSQSFKATLADPEFQQIAMEHSARDWGLFQRYMTQNAFFDEKQAALVDIGWSGTIQKFLQEAFSDSANYPHVYGLYLGFIGGIAYQFDPKKNSLMGVMCDERDKSRPQDMFRRFIELFEEGARALHPTTIGYREDETSGQVVPVLKSESAADRQAELHTNAQIAEFQKGILDFASELGRTVDLLGYGFDDIHPFVMTLLERAVVYPTEQERRELLQLTHAEDFGYENTMTFRHESVGSWKAIFRPRSLRFRLAQSNWRYGTASSIGIPGFNFLLRTYDLFRTKSK